MKSLSVGIKSEIGSRDRQEDSGAALITGAGKGALAIVCDGIGSMPGGAFASQYATEQFVKYMQNEGFAVTDPSIYMVRLVQVLDKAINCFTLTSGTPLEAGTTLVATYVHNGRFWWVSVGDSRIYHKQTLGLTLLTTDHNYRYELELAFKRGIIRENISSNNPDADALISYVGMGDISIVDYGYGDFADNDTLLLCSDGLTKLMADEKIYEYMKNNEHLTAQVFVEELVTEAFGDKKTIAADNITIAIIK